MNLHYHAKLFSRAIVRISHLPCTGPPSFSNFNALFQLWISVTNKMAQKTGSLILSAPHMPSPAKFCSFMCQEFTEKPLRNKKGTEPTITLRINLVTKMHISFDMMGLWPFTLRENQNIIFERRWTFLIIIFGLSYNITEICSCR